LEGRPKENDGARTEVESAAFSDFLDEQGLREDVEGEALRAVLNKQLKTPASRHSDAEPLSDPARRGNS
jgi:hypothetical protein